MSAFDQRLVVALALGAGAGIACRRTIQNFSPDALWHELSPPLRASEDLVVTRDPDPTPSPRTRKVA